MSRFGVLRPAVAMVLILLLIVSSHGAPIFSAIAQDTGTPVAEELQADEPVLEEEPLVEVPAETSLPDLPAEPPPVSTDSGELPATEVVEAPVAPIEETAVEGLLEPTLEPSLTPTTEPSFIPSPTETEAVDPAAILTGTLILRVYNEDGSPNTISLTITILEWGNGDAQVSGRAPLTTTVMGEPITQMLPEGHYVAIFPMNLFQVSQMEFSIYPGETTTVEQRRGISPVPSGRVSFDVVDTDGQRIGDAEACPVDFGCSYLGGGFSSVGVLSRNLFPVGATSFYLMAVGYQTKLVTVDIVAGEVIHPTVELEPYAGAATGTLSVAVTTEDGGPVSSDYVLTVTGPGNGASTYFGEPQNLTLTDLVPGWYQVSLGLAYQGPEHGGDYADSAERIIYVKAGVPNYAQLVLPRVARGDVTFVLEPSPGLTREYWFVALIDADGNEVRAQTFDFYWQVSFQGVPLGDYRYEVYYAPYRPSTDRVGTSGKVTVSGTPVSIPVSLPVPAQPLGRGKVEIELLSTEGVEGVHGEVCGPLGTYPLDCEVGSTGQSVMFFGVPAGPATFTMLNQTGDDFSVNVAVVANETVTGTIVVPYVSLSQTGTVTFEFYLEDGTPSDTSDYSIELLGPLGRRAAGRSILGSNVIVATDVAAGVRTYVLYGDGKKLRTGTVTVVARQNTTARVELPLSTELPPPPTATSTASATTTTTNTPTFIPSSTASVTVTATNTATPTSTPSPTATATAPPPTSSPTRTPSLTPTAEMPTGSGIIRSNVNCRTLGSSSGTSLGVVAKNTAVPVRGAAVNGWTPVVCFGQNGWISSSYVQVAANPTLTITPTRPTITPTRTATGGTQLGTGVVTSNVNCRASASTSATSYGTVAKNTTLSLRGVAQNGWTPVICFGKNGWISSSYLTLPARATNTPTLTATQTPTKTPTLVAGLSYVATITDAQCHANGSNSGASLGVVPTDTILIQRGFPANGWYPVVCFEQNGWILATSLRTVPGPHPPTLTLTPRPPSTTPTTGVSFGSAVAKSNVNCRTSASTSDTIIGLVSKNATLQLRGAAQGGWYPVVCLGQNGWISASYLTPTTNATATHTPTRTATLPSGSTMVTTASVNCRATGASNGTVVSVLAKKTTVPLRGTAVNGWTPVVCGGQNGWVSSQYLRT